MKKAIAAAGTCAKPHRWRHTATVIGARSVWNLKPKPAAQRTYLVEGRRRRGGDGPDRHFAAGGGAPTAATLRSSLDGASSTSLMQLGGLVKANNVRSFKLSPLQLVPGRYVFAALLHATMNPGTNQAAGQQAVHDPLMSSTAAPRILPARSRSRTSFASASG